MIDVEIAQSEASSWRGVRSRQENKLQFRNEVFENSQSSR